MDDNEEILNKLIDLTIMIILLMMKKVQRYFNS